MLAFIHSAPLLFRRESFREQIDTGGHEPRKRLIVFEDGVGFASFELGPLDRAAVEVAGID